jgi:DNA-directed RNA polymerase subunit M/transcription elongation factor TFIIS
MQTPDEEKKKATFRLTDMVVESVDLVDRAANKRRFLLVKREDDMAGKVKTATDQGEVINVIVADPESGVEKAEEDKAKKPCEVCGKDPCVCEKEKDKEKAKKVCETCGKDPCVCAKDKEKAKPKEDVKCPDCGQTPCVCKKEAKAEQGKTGDKKVEEEKAALVCPKCGYEGAGKVGSMCPKCNTALESPKKKSEEDKACKKPKTKEEELLDEKNGKKPTKEEVLAEEEKGDVMVCPKCGATMPKPPNYKGGDFKCPKCDGMMKPKGAKSEKPEAKEEKPAKDEKTEKGTEKAMPKPVQEALLAGMREATERLMSVVSVLRSATVTQEQSPAPLPNKIFGEVEAIKTLLASIVQRYPSPTSKSDAEIEECVRGVLKQGGLSLPGPVRDAVVEKVRAVIEKLLSAMRVTRETTTTDEKLDNPMPTGLSSAIKSCVTELESITSKYPSPSSKSASMLDDLQKHLAGIKEIVATALNGMPIADMTIETKKSDDKKDDVIAALNKRLDDLTASFKELQGKKFIPGSNAADADDGKTETKKSKGFTWPLDLAEGLGK